MRAAGPMILFLGVLAMAGPTVPLDGPSAAEIEHNRRLLEKMRTADPDQYARLKRDLQELEALSPERQASLRQLDRDLHKEAPAVQQRLLHVMDRYAAWLERLPAAERKQLDEAPTAAERLRLVREFRERQWLDRLPQARRQQVLAATGERRAALITELRQQEHQRRQEWQHPPGAPEEPAARRQPHRLSDLPPVIQLYVTTSLQPLLNAEDREKLKIAEGQWPLYGGTLLELAEKYAPALPGPALGPTRLGELPKDVRQHLAQLRNPEKLRLHQYEGRWPDFAIAVTEVFRSKKEPLPQELGPCHPKDYPDAMKMPQFLDQKLLPKLSAKEREQLASAEGKWPEHPRAILDLARRHNLQVPRQPLPGPPEFWENLRTALANGP